MALHIAMLSIHSSPIGTMGERDTGGMSVYVRELARHMGAKGHMVDIFTLQTQENTGEVIQLSANVRLVYLQNDKAKDLFCYDHTYSIDSIDSIAHELSAAIHAFSNRAGIVYNLIHSNYWLSGVVGRGLKKIWGCPHIITFHTLATAKTAAVLNHSEHACRMEMESTLARECDRVLAPTLTEKKRLQELYNDGGEKIDIVPCGVDLELFKPLDTAGLQQQEESTAGCNKLLFVGRFDPMKGIDLLLSSLRLLPNKPPVELLIIGGDGHKSSAYQNIVRSVETLGLERNVHLIGTVEHHLMPRYYSDADTVVVSSHYESFGLVVLESLACGTPVASTRVGVAPQVIESGVNGYLAEVGDASSLADSIAASLRITRDRLKIRTSVHDYGWPQVAKILLNVYGDAININTKLQNGTPS